MKNRKKIAYILLLLIVLIYIFSKVRTSYIFYCTQNNNSINKVNSELKESNSINTVENTQKLLKTEFNINKLQNRNNFFIHLSSNGDIKFLKFLINNQYISINDVYSYSKLLNDSNYFEKFTPSRFPLFPSKYAKEKFKCTNFMNLVSEPYLTEDSVKLILDNNKNLNLNLQDSQGNTIIFYCIENNKFLNLFLKENVDLKKQNNLGITALMFATMKNDIKQIALLQNKENSLELRDKRGYTALSWAVYLDNFDSVDYLIKIGSNKYVKDIYGNSLYEISNSNKMRKFLKRYM